MLGRQLAVNCDVYHFQGSDKTVFGCSRTLIGVRSVRAFGFQNVRAVFLDLCFDVFCSALFLDCSVFCFVRPSMGCVLFGCFVRALALSLCFVRMLFWAGPLSVLFGFGV